MKNKEIKVVAKVTNESITNLDKISGIKKEISKAINDAFETTEVKIVIEKLSIMDIIEEINKCEYCDPAEHVYDAIKYLQLHLDKDDYMDYIHNAIWGLTNSSVIPYDDKLGKQIERLKEVYERLKKLNEK